MSRHLSPAWYASASDSTYLEQTQASPIAVALGAAISALLVHWLLSLLDYPILSLPELAWNTFVWLMPARIVYALKPGLNGSSTDRFYDASSGGSTEHAAKSEVLRDVFKLSGGSASTKRKATSSAPAGLGNWDNSCYQNSVLQALSSITSLRGFYDQLQRRGVVFPEDTTISALQKIMSDLNDEDNKGRKIWTPAKLKSMSSWQQQDAQEYFSKVVDSLEKDLLAAVRKQPLDRRRLDLASLATVDDAAGSGGPKNEQGGRSSQLPRASQEIANPLEGLLAQRVGCTRCGYVEGLSLIPFNCVTLPIGRNWSYDIRECLDEYTFLETIEGVECAKCTLLQTRHQLRQHMEDLATASEDDEGPSDKSEELQQELEQRLDAVNEALHEDDFSERTLKQKCLIGPKQKVSSNKTKQVMIMRTPQCMVLHVNRSLFDESTGAQLKNYADVSYQGSFDASPWCVGKTMKLKLDGGVTPVEEWEMDPTRSMSSANELLQHSSDRNYRLSAVITHYGRHENGHYVCYRKLPPSENPSSSLQGEAKDESAQDAPPDNHDQWWRLSDEDVSAVPEEEALSQGGVFMLFYEKIDSPRPPPRIVRSSVLAEVKTREQEAAASRMTEEELQVLDYPYRPDESPQHPLVAEEAKAEARVKSSQPQESTENCKPPSHPGKASNSDEDSIHEPQQQYIPEPRKQISPTTMRTAGMHQRSSEDFDTLRTPPMISTT